MPTIEEYYGMIEGEFLKCDRKELINHIAMSYRMRLPVLIAIAAIAGWLGLGHSGETLGECQDEYELTRLRAEMVLETV